MSINSPQLEMTQMSSSEGVEDRHTDLSGLWNSPTRVNLQRLMLSDKCQPQRKHPVGMHFYTFLKCSSYKRKIVGCQGVRTAWGRSCL